MSKIRLSQEGKRRSSGFQATQWINRIPAGVTDPLNNAELFVFRNVSGRESFDRVATLLDLVSIPINELKYFSCKRTGGSFLDAILPGDQLLITTSIPYWLQDEAPYTDQWFTVDAVEPLAFGSNPTILTGNRLQLPGYSLTKQDLGRWIFLSGFATTGYNVAVQILSVEANTARISLTTTSNEVGTSWTTSRIRIKIDEDPLVENRYFPTMEGPLSWQVYRDSVLITSGDAGFTERTLPLLDVYRDHRVTTLEPTEEQASFRFINTRAYIQQLQEQLDVIDTNFLTTTIYDYPVIL
jgi:hypothetical protein